jgi:hypothetical protein
VAAKSIEKQINQPVLGIRDFLVRIRIPGSVSFTIDPVPTPDTTPFFIDFKDAKQLFFNIFFLITCPQTYHFQSKKFNFCKNFVLYFILQPLFHSTKHSKR